MPTLSKDGQIRIPADIRRRHGWAAGQALDVVETDAGVTLRPAAAPTPDEIRAALDRVADVAAYTGPPIPVEKMNLSAISYEEMYPDGP